MRTVVRSAFAIISATVLAGCASTTSAPSRQPLQNRLVADVTGRAPSPTSKRSSGSPTTTAATEPPRAKSPP